MVKMLIKKQKNNLQNIFLNKLLKEKIPITIFLKNGVKLEGVIMCFDDFSVLLYGRERQQLVYKQAISTIMPVTSLSLLKEKNEEKNKESKKN